MVNTKKKKHLLSGPGRKKRRKSKILSVGLILAFFVLSFLYIRPEHKNVRSPFRSSQLNKITVTDDTAERIDYIDSKGQITVAADLGYATMLVTKAENSRLEQFFDEKGEPIANHAPKSAGARTFSRTITVK